MDAPKSITEIQFTEAEVLSTGLGDAAYLIAQAIEEAGKVQALEIHHGLEGLANVLERIAEAMETALDD